MTMLPEVGFGGRGTTRLIIGGNPLRGNSHFSREMDEDMRRFFTVERIKETLHAAERCGINTVQARGDVLILQCVREYWDEGGTMRFVAQTASELRDLRGHVRQLAAFGAAGIYVHGTFTDRCFLEGGLQEVRDLLLAIRDTGLPTGLGTHIPEVIDRAEEEAWDLDFYMAALYNISVPSRESAIGGKGFQAERFDHDDRFKMLDRVRRTRKMCLVFKVLGASRLCATPAEVRKAFALVYETIKPGDAAVVGMFPKYGNQIAENCALLREILGVSEAT